MKTEISRDKALFLNSYAMMGLPMTCIAKTFQLPDRRLDGVLFNIRGDYALCLSVENHLDFYDINEWVLPLRTVSMLTDEEVIHIARLSHQMINSDFTIDRNSDLIHANNTNNVGITHHISLYKDYGTVNSNVHFSKTETEPFKTFKANIGETTLSSERPVLYIAICDYLRSIGVLIPFMGYSVKQILKNGWATIKPLHHEQTTTVGD